MIKGLIAPILTPFSNDLTLNQNLYNEFAKNLLEKCFLEINEKKLIGIHS